MFKPKDKKVILYLVDDDDLHLKIVESKIKSSSRFDVKLYHSGEEFLDDINKNPFPSNAYAIVLLDYYLKTRDVGSTKNGIEILKILKDTYPSVEVIMLSASDDINVATSSMHYGAVTYIKKNENSFARILSNVQWIISRKNLENKKRQHRITRQFFIFLLFLILILAAVYLVPSLI